MIALTFCAINARMGRPAWGHQLEHAKVIREIIDKGWKNGRDEWQPPSAPSPAACTGRSNTLYLSPPGRGRG
ncbi:MAG: hypothetical protein OEV06_02760 [Anaerolineae bacterium]|nr:hypothetical protein [Anaerolineae bacterium]